MNTADVLRERDCTGSIVALERVGVSRANLCRRGYPLELIPAVPLPRRPNRDLIALPGRLKASVRAVRDVMERQGTDVVVGFGGYVAMPAYLAARGRVPPSFTKRTRKPDSPTAWGTLHAVCRPGGRWFTA